MNNKSIRAILKKNTMLIVLIIVYLFFVIMTKGAMFSPANFSELINQNAYVFILGAGMLMCMLTGGNIDLSVGSFVCLVCAFGGIFLTIKHMSVGVTIGLMLLIGIVYGVILGFLIAYIRIPPWIATLAGFLAFRGWGTAILRTKSPETSSILFSENFNHIFFGRLFQTAPGEWNIPALVFGVLAAVAIIALSLLNRSSKLKKGYEADSLTYTLVKSILEGAVIMLFMFKFAKDGGIPTTFLWVAIVLAIYAFITEKTTIGRHFYVVGGNSEAARLSGIDTRKVMFLAYLNMSILTTLAGMTVVSRNQAAIADLGKNFEMDAISACVVGGVSTSGGSGTILGMVVGALLIGVINLGMSLISLDANWQRVIKGVVLLAAVVFDILSKKKEK